MHGETMKFFHMEFVKFHMDHCCKF